MHCHTQPKKNMSKKLYFLGISATFKNVQIIYFKISRKTFLKHPTVNELICYYIAFHAKYISVDNPTSGSCVLQ